MVLAMEVNKPCGKSGSLCRNLHTSHNDPKIDFQYQSAAFAHRKESGQIGCRCGQVGFSAFQVASLPTCRQSSCHVEIRIIANH